MSLRGWPPVVSLLPGARGLDCNVAPAPKYEQLALLSASPLPALESVDLGRQEQQLVRDGFRVLVGGEGDFVKFVETFDPAVLDDRLLGPRYRLQSGIDRGLRDVVTRIADVASGAYAVRTFADHFAGLEYGRVNQALAAAMRVLLSLYLEIVAKLEADLAVEGSALTLYQVWMRLEPFWPHLRNAQRLMRRFIEETRLVRDHKRQTAHEDLMARATTAQFVAHGEQEATIELRGGAVLRTIASQLRLELGNAAAANLYNELLAAASKPYLSMLQKWLSKGEIDDPHDEFLIQETGAYNPIESGQQSVDDYWDKRYTIRAIDLPLQLSQSSLYDRLLVAGKYLNVIRDTTGALHQVPHQVDLRQCESIEDARVAEVVSQTYRYANLALLDLFKTDKHNLRSLLRTLRSVFFLTESGSFSSFLDMAQDELAKPANTVSLAQLESLLALARGPDDAASDSVGLSLAQESLREAMLRIVANSSTYDPPSRSGSSLTAIDALQLTYEVPFPLSLVVPRRSIVRYQFLFRHIVDMVMAQRALTEAWKLQMLTTQWRVTDSTEIGEWKHRAHMLRQRQLLFTNELLHHCTQDGIHRGWTELYESIDEFEEVSELVDRHISFLDRCLVNCYLAHPQLLRFQTRLLTQCRQYGQFLKANIQLMEYMTSDPTETMLDAEGNELRPEDLLNWFASHIERYENSFNRNLQRYYEQLRAFVPTNFVAGGATASLMQRLEPLLEEPLEDASQRELASRHHERQQPRQQLSTPGSPPENTA